MSDPVVPEYKNNDPAFLSPEVKHAVIKFLESPANTFQQLLRVKTEQINELLKLNKDLTYRNDELVQDITDVMDERNEVLLELNKYKDLVMKIKSKRKARRARKEYELT